MARVQVQTALHILHDSAADGDAATPVAVDIVAVHGLNFKNKANHAWETWTSKEKLWVRDFLPGSLERPARVMLFEYNSSPVLSSAVLNLVDHAKSLLHWLSLSRKSCPERPLVFICHSLGGLVVKEALVESHLDSSYSPIASATRLVVFFATPHRGGKFASFGDIVGKIVRLGGHSNDLIENLKAKSDIATRRFEQFLSLCNKYLVVSFIEGLPYGKLGTIVPKESAILGLPGASEKQVPMSADHSTICKFDSASSPACELTLRTISTELERALGLEHAQTGVRPEVKRISELEEQDKQCVRALYQVTGEYENQRDEIDSPVDGTCKWVLGNAQFRRWLLATGPSLLWITANPGCGKSVLAGFVVDELASSQPDAIVFPFFFHGGHERRTRSHQALCALLHSIFTARPDLIHYARNQFAAKGDRFAVVPEQLWKILCAISEASQPTPCQIIFIVDGLDECEGPSRDVFLRAVTRTFSSRCPESFRGGLKILITSRPLLDIERQLQPLGDIRLRSEDDFKCLSRDLKRYIRHKVHELETTETLTAEVCKIVAEKFASGADMTFLWVSLMLKNIMRLDSTKRSRVEEVLEQSPSDLDNLYGIALSAATERSLQLLQCLLAATRQLSLSEINIALGMERDVKSLGDLDDELEANIEKTVKRLGGFFVRFVGSNVQLVHQTAREFLLQAAPVNHSSHYHLSLSQCNIVLADRCARFLALPDWITCRPNVNYLARERNDYDPGKALLRNLKPKHRQFYKYAAENWFIHVRAGAIPIENSCLGASSLDSVTQRIRNSVRIICGQGRMRLDTWWSIYAPPSFYIGRAGQQFLHHAVYHGELTLLQCLLVSEDFCVTDQNENGYDVLAFAAKEGKEDIVSWALANPLHKDMRLQRETALMESLYRGHIRLVDRLLDFNIDLNTSYKFDVPQSWSQCMRPLAAAVRSCPISVLESLVSKGADVLESDVFENAIKSGRLDALRWLLRRSQNYGDSSKRSEVFISALKAAAKVGQLGMMDLIESSGNISPPEGCDYQRGLTAAAVRRDMENFKRLLSMGIRADVSTLRVSVLWPEGLRLALAHHSCTEEQLEDGIVQLASYYAPASVWSIFRLLTKGYFVKRFHYYFGPPCGTFKDPSTRKSMSLLLQALYPAVPYGELVSGLQGVENIMDMKYGHLTLHRRWFKPQDLALVCLFGNWKAARRLVSWGFPVTQRGKLGIPPLLAAVISGNSGLVQFLREEAADPDELYAFDPGRHTLASAATFNDEPRAPDVASPDDLKSIRSRLSALPESVEKAWAIVQLAFGPYPFFETPISLAKQLDRGYVLGVLNEPGVTRNSDTLFKLKSILDGEDVTVKAILDSSGPHTGPIVAHFAQFPGHQGRTLLHRIAAQGADGLLQVIIDNQELLRPPTTDQLAKMPMDAASKHGMSEKVLGFKALLSVQDDDGRTPLHLAILAGHLGISKRLIQLGSPLLQDDENLHLPLHHAIRAAINSGDTTFFRDVWEETKRAARMQDRPALTSDTTKDRDGRNVLHLTVLATATWRPSDVSQKCIGLHIVKDLVLDGVDYETPDNAGNTPLAYTEKYTGDSSIEALEPLAEQAIRDIQQFLLQAPFLGHAGLDQNDIRSFHENCMDLAKQKEWDCNARNASWEGWELHNDDGDEEWDCSGDEDGTVQSGDTEVEDKGAEWA